MLAKVLKNMSVHGARLPSEIIVHVFDSKGKGKDNSDMLAGRWSDIFYPCQGRGDCGNPSIVTLLPKCLALSWTWGFSILSRALMCESLMKVKPPV